MPDLNHAINQHHKTMAQWWLRPEYREAMGIFKQKKPYCERCGRPTTTALHKPEDYCGGFDRYLEVVVNLTAEAGCNACNLAERNNLHPCPGCCAKFHGGLTDKIRYIPEQVEVCRDCRNPEERGLQERENERWEEVVRQCRVAKNEKDRTARRPYLDGQNLRRKEFYCTGTSIGQ